MAKPKDFDGANMKLLGDGAGVLDMQALYKDGVLWSCWELTDEELVEMVKTRRAWVGMFVGSERPFPLTVSGHQRDIDLVSAAIREEVARQAGSGSGGDGPQPGAGAARDEGTSPRKPH